MSGLNCVMRDEYPAANTSAANLLFIVFSHHFIYFLKVDRLNNKNLLPKGEHIIFQLVAPLAFFLSLMKGTQKTFEILSLVNQSLTYHLIIHRQHYQAVLRQKQEPLHQNQNENHGDLPQDWHQPAHKQPALLVVVLSP